MSGESLWEGFAAAVVHLELPTGTVLLEPRPVGDVGAFPFEGPVHIVTAYNPDGLQIDDEANMSRHRELMLATAGFITIPSIGSALDGSMREPGFALIDASLTDSVALGRRFGQVAIYQWTADALTIVGVDEVHHLRLGWALS